MHFACIHHPGCGGHMEVPTEVPTGHISSSWAWWSHGGPDGGPDRPHLIILGVVVTWRSRRRSRQ